MKQEKQLPGASLLHYRSRLGVAVTGCTLRRETQSNHKRPCFPYVCPSCPDVRATRAEESGVCERMCEIPVLRFRREFVLVPPQTSVDSSWGGVTPDKSSVALGSGEAFSSRSLPS
ncbi:hypothetical protein E2C01_085200 [Portunus trituberculatus]|uniref:Uncharacterized protein n=1 Tax=Portunus trituberculatus TaxID=210409 RepID=A0A5B7J873_PORTR|nr:hypothetical protein [Portunus trituberculatus]